MRLYSRWREQHRKRHRNEIGHLVLKNLRKLLRPSAESKRRVPRKEAGEIGRG